FLYSSPIDIDAKKTCAVHRGRKRLSAAHTAHPSRNDQLAFERPAEVLCRRRCKRLERSLNDSLAANVDPRTRGHLSVHRQAHTLEPMKLFPVRPLADEIRGRDQHSRRVFVRSENSDGLAGLNEQRLVVLALAK